MLKRIAIFSLALNLISCSNEKVVNRNPESCSKYSAEAEKMYKEKNYTRLINMPSDACDTSTKIKVLSYKAMAFMDLNQFSQAIETFSALIAIHPYDAPLYGQRGLAYDHLEKYPEAINDYN